MKYSDTHEWVRLEDGVATVGISKHAQKELGEIVYIELPTLGKNIRAGQEVAVLESTKAAADIYSPVSGEVVEINQSLADMTEKLNQFPESEGWLYKIKLSNAQELDALMNGDAYAQMLQ
jgi:glycine cleavage system H protein